MFTTTTLFIILFISIVLLLALNFNITNIILSTLALITYGMINREISNTLIESCINRACPTEVKRIYFNDKSPVERLRKDAGPISINQATKSSKGVLILQGALVSPKTYENLARKLSNDLQYDIFIPTMTGHGGRPQDINNFDTDKAEADWLEEIKYFAKQYSTLFVVCHSASGAVVANLAAKKLLPENVKIVFCAPAIKLQLSLAQRLYALAYPISGDYFVLQAASDWFGVDNPPADRTTYNWSPYSKKTLLNIDQYASKAYVNLKSSPISGAQVLMFTQDDTVDNEAIKDGFKGNNIKEIDKAPHGFTRDPNSEWVYDEVVKAIMEMEEKQDKV